jgi:8-oxo-dGTP diphosphatase
MAVVRLAGGILWRDSPGTPRLVVIHRPKQRDWSLPKGRLDDGESWEEAALREVEEETGCEARITSFAGATFYVPRRIPRIVLYWHMALVREGRLDGREEVDELAWLSPADAVKRLDHETERRLLERVPPNLAGRRAARPGGVLAAEIAVARAELLRHLLRLGDGDAAGAGPALELLDQADEALARGGAEEARRLVGAARQLQLLGLAEPELSLRARALREEGQSLAPWRRRAVRRLLPQGERPSPEAVYLAAEICAEERQGRASWGWRAGAATAAAVGALAIGLWLAPSGRVKDGLTAVAFGAAGGAAACALIASRWASGKRAT